jgi:hypothetical protein
MRPSSFLTFVTGGAFTGLHLGFPARGGGLLIRRGGFWIGGQRFLRNSYIWLR